MTIDKCFQLGHITKPHGYKGSVVLFLDVDDSSEYRNIDALFLKVGESLVPFFITKSDVKGKQLILQLEGVTNEEEAENLRGKEAYLPLELLPKLKGNQFYFHEVIGYTVEDEKHGMIGEIKAIMEHSANPLFICDYRGTEALLPFHDHVLRKVDRAKKIITLDLPEGLLELYSGDSKEQQED
ncbi:MAG: 16S rRNA processing protein RimM [Cryomorphaceae bacterium]|nr:16S rRNA processing protein RimM [Cryomorphaceae bacterium]